MKKILFIIPKLGTGGTNSSLDSLYPLLKGKFALSVFSLSHHPYSHNYSFGEVLLPKDYYLSLLYANYSDQRGINRITAFVIKVYRVVMRKMGVDIGQRRCLRIVKRLERETIYDYIVGYQEGNATKFAAMFNNKNKIAWIHADYNKYLEGNVSEEKIYEQFKTIVSVSEYTTSVFSQRYPSLSNRTVAIHNIIDVSRVLRLAEDSIEDNRFVRKDYLIISVGRLARVKRFSLIPSIAASLRDRGLLFTWYIIGPKYQHDEYEELQCNIGKYKVTDCVKWLGEKSNPYPYFSASHLYVCLSDSEACPMVFKEAQLLGLPIVTTNFPSSYEFVNDENGIISTIDGIPDAILQMKNCYDRGIRMTKGMDDNDRVIEKICSLFS